MPDTIACPQCRKSLSVPESLYGTQVQCPACGAVFTAGPTGVSRSPLPPAPPPPPPERPVMRFDEREPPRRSEYDDYGDRDRDRHDRDRYDRDRDDRYDRGGYRDRDYYGGPRRDAAPHRGGAILTLAIIGLVVSLCPILGWIFGGIATNMAKTDLAKMDRGEMDRDGRGTTETGKLIGNIAIGIATVSAILGVLIRIGGGIR
jgi:hypothetical protein